MDKLESQEDKASLKKLLETYDSEVKDTVYTEEQAMFLLPEFKN